MERRIVTPILRRVSTKKQQKVDDVRPSPNKHRSLDSAPTTWTRSGAPMRDGFPRLPLRSDRGNDCLESNVLMPELVHRTPAGLVRLRVQCGRRAELIERPLSARSKSYGLLELPGKPIRLMCLKRTSLKKISYHANCWLGVAPRFLRAGCLTTQPRKSPGVTRSRTHASR